jgi:drug/metabolite transporter (DMT)-like permease
MASIFFALLAATLYGSADFLGGLASRRASVIAVMIFSQLAGLVTLLLALPFLPPATASRADFAWGALGGATLGIGLMLLYQGLATGKMSVVAPVTAVLAVVVAAVAGIAGGDRLSLGAFAGVALAITAIALISQDGVPDKEAMEGREWDAARGLATALVAGVLLGAFFVALKHTSSASGLLPLVAARLASLGAVGAVALSRHPPFRVGPDAVWLIILGGALDIFANVLYLLAARQGMLTIAATLSSLYPASTILLARLILGERLRRIQMAGLACAGIGVALIGAG